MAEGPFPFSPRLFFPTDTFIFSTEKMNEIKNVEKNILFQPRRSYTFLLRKLIGTFSRQQNKRKTIPFLKNKRIQNYDTSQCRTKINKVSVQKLFSKSHFNSSDEFLSESCLIEPNFGY